MELNAPKQIIEAKAKTVRKMVTKNKVIALQFLMLACALYVGYRMFVSNYVLVSPIVKIDGYISQTDAHNYMVLANSPTTTVSSNCILNPDLCK